MSAQSGFGIRAGINFANQNISVDGIGDLDTDSKGGLDVAILYNAAFESGFAIQPEIHYAQSGYKGEITINNLTQEVVAELNYVQVPILFKFDVLGVTDNISLSPFIGPYVALGVTGDVQDIEIDWDEDYNRLDYGGVLGVMLQFTPGFFVDARYNFGLANIAHDEDSDRIEIKNAIFGLGVGFIF